MPTKPKSKSEAKKMPAVKAGKKPSKMALRKARVTDAAQIQNLIKYYSKKEEMLPRSINEIYENLRDFTVLEQDGYVMACGGLHVCWNDLAEIKSLAVAPELQGQGCGSRLVKHFVKEARDLGIPRVFTLTFRPGFFEKQGFVKVEMNDLPKKVWIECVKCVHFPDCGEEALVFDL